MSILPILIKVGTQSLGQLGGYPSASEVTLKDMGTENSYK